MRKYQGDRPTIRGDRPQFPGQLPRKSRSVPTYHIDLWRESKLASIGGALTFIRQTFPGIAENYLDMSDLRRASEILFWKTA